MKIFVAIPVYDAKLPLDVVNCLLNEKSVAHGFGDDLVVGFLFGDAGIAGARNQLVQNFLDSGADRLVFLDADITFECGSLIKLAHMPVDFVGGAYRHKQEPESYPIEFLPNEELWLDQYGLVEVAKLPTGFMALSRKVFEVLKEKHPDREYQHQDSKAFCYFQMPFKDGALFGEDYFFCKEWIEAGGKIYLDPKIKLKHWSFAPRSFDGDIFNWVKNQPAQETKENQNA